MTATPRTLTQMQLGPTYYEVALDGEVIGYTARKTKASLLSFAQAHAEEILAKLGDADPDAVYKKGRWTFGPVTVAFTGRTEREAASLAGRV